MDRDRISDLISVAEERSFTKAAARLDATRPALSHAVEGLEKRLGLRLPTRTTCSVAPKAGGDPLATLSRCFERIEARLQARRPTAGTSRRGRCGSWARIRHRHDALAPARACGARASRNVRRIRDGSRFHRPCGRACGAGVRDGDKVGEGMISARIRPDERMVRVAAPEYFAAPGVPQTRRKLRGHACINLRLSTHGALRARVRG